MKNTEKNSGNPLPKSESKSPTPRTDNKNQSNRGGRNLIGNSNKDRSNKPATTKRLDIIAGNTPSSKKKPEKTIRHGLKVIPLGGLQEIGKNITVLEYENEIIIIDCGLSFPDDEMYGIDVVIPDFTYLIENAKKIKGLFITHGHEDHIGAVPYLLKHLNIPIYGTALPLGLIKHKLEEHGIRGKLNKIQAGSKTRIGKFTVEAIRVTHSIADSVCYCVETPVGRVFHTGDFKIDYTPVDGEPMDLSKLAELGGKGILLMMADSTNSTRKGFTRSEKLVGEALENIFRNSSSRIIIATFSSNVHRIQKIIDHAVKFKRKVAVSGRSMINVVNLARELGYLKVPDNTILDINKTRKIPDKELVIITTGSQGEPMSALSRMARSEHKAIEIKSGDQVILSSTAIPGNEKLVSNVVNKLFQKGAEVIYSDIADTHVSGHACEEELKLIHSLIKPKFFMPVHGEFRHLKAHGDIARDLGMDGNDIYLLENGDCLNLTKNQAKHQRSLTRTEGVMVDGLGVGDVGNIVLRDRRLLSESGLIIVVATVDRVSRKVMAGPHLLTRGFVYVRDNEDLIDQATTVVEGALEKCQSTGATDWNSMKFAVRDDLRRFIYGRTERNPVILPIFMEV